MATPGDEVQASIETFTDVQSDVIDTDDGGAIIRLGADESERPNREWYDNIADDFDDAVKSKIATRLLQDVERDRRAREKREKDYEEAIKRTGLGKETPGGADFEGASKAVHPMLTEAVVDFQSRSIKDFSHQWQVRRVATIEQMQATSRMSRRDSRQQMQKVIDDGSRNRLTAN